MNYIKAPVQAFLQSTTLKLCLVLCGSEGLLTGLSFPLFLRVIYSVWGENSAHTQYTHTHTLPYALCLWAWSSSRFQLKINCTFAQHPLPKF